MFWKKSANDAEYPFLKIICLNDANQSGIQYKIVINHAKFISGW